VIRCPQCGNEDDFAIDAVAYKVAYVHQISAEESAKDPDIWERPGTL
jgi:anaerobic ribonucleoside-triphosphate reductase